MKRIFILLLVSVAVTCGAQPEYVKLYFPGFQIARVSGINHDFNNDSTENVSTMTSGLLWRGEAFGYNKRRFIFGLDFSGLLSGGAYLKHAYAGTTPSKISGKLFGAYAPLLHVSIGATGKGKENRNWGLSYNFGMFPGYITTGLSWYGLYSFGDWYFAPKLTSDFAFINGRGYKGFFPGAYRYIDLTFGKSLSDKGWGIAVSPIFSNTSFRFKEEDANGENAKVKINVFQVQFGLCRSF